MRASLPLLVCAIAVAVVSADGSAAGKQLIAAAAAGNKADVEALLDVNYAEELTDVNFVDGEGFTALHVATASDHKETVSLLLDKGANVDAANNQGLTPLFLAIWKGHSILAKTLILERDASIDVTTSDGTSLLVVAAGSGEFDVAKTLLDRGARVEPPDDGLGGSLAKMLVAAAGCSKNVPGATFVINHLLDERGVAVDAPDGMGRRALHEAAARGHVALATLLISRGASVEEPSSDGHRPLFEAAANGQVDSINLLLDSGAAVDGKSTAPMSMGVTALQTAVANGHTKAVTALLGRHALIQAKDDRGRTVVHVAAERGNLSMLKLLMKRVSPVRRSGILNIADEQEYTALALAIHGKHEPVVKYLKELKAEVVGRKDEV